MAINFWSQFQPVEDVQPQPTRAYTGGVTGGMSGGFSLNSLGGGQGIYNPDPDTQMPDPGSGGGPTVPQPTPSPSPAPGSTPAPGDPNAAIQAAMEQARKDAEAGSKQAYGNQDIFWRDMLAAAQQYGYRTVDQLKAWIQANPQYGVRLGGSKGDKIYGPDGSFWGDGVMSAGTGGTGWYRGGTGGDSGSTGTSGLGSLDGMHAGQYTAPWTEQFQNPTVDDLYKMPGYQAGLSAFKRVGINDQAARGQLGNARVQQGLDEAANNYGQQAYSSLRDMARSDYLLRRDNFYGNQDRPFDKYYRLADLGKP